MSACKTNLLTLPQRMEPTSQSSLKEWNLLHHAHEFTSSWWRVSWSYLIVNYQKDNLCSEPRTGFLLHQGVFLGQATDCPYPSTTPWFRAWLVRALRSTLSMTFGGCSWIKVYWGLIWFTRIVWWVCESESIPDHVDDGRKSAHCMSSSYGNLQLKTATAIRIIRTVAMQMHFPYYRLWVLLDQNFAPWLVNVNVARSFWQLQMCEAFAEPICS